MNKIFVYGTLMHGQPNHYLLESAEYFGQAVSCERYHVMSMGAFPAITINSNRNNWKIEGELYLCNNETLQLLDMLESNGWLYLRRMRPFKIIVDKESAIIQHAWVYELIQEIHTEKTPLICDDFKTYNDQVAIWDPKDVSWWT